MPLQTLGGVEEVDSVAPKSCEVLGLVAACADEALDLGGVYLLGHGVGSQSSVDPWRRCSTPALGSRATVLA